MPAFACEVFIRPRTDILDPEGDAVQRALTGLGFTGADGVRVGRYLRLTLSADSEGAARATLGEMCDKLLANPVTEDYELSVKPA
jgi:phosphoribosylformylglycinamidine synthase